MGSTVPVTKGFTNPSVSPMQVSHSPIPFMAHNLLMNGFAGMLETSTYRCKHPQVESAICRQICAGRCSRDLPSIRRQQLDPRFPAA